MQSQETQPTSGEQSVVRSVFGVVARGQTWRNFVHLWLDFPLGLFYLVVLVIALTMGIGLVITLVGVPILLLTAALWWCFAAFERVLARGLLGADVPPAPRPWTRGEGVMGRLKAHFGAGVTYTDLVYLFVKFPLGFISFVLCVTGAAMVVAFVGAPLFQLSGSLYLFGERVDSWALALLLVPVGVVAFFGWMHLLNGWAWVERRVAEGMLRGEAAPEAPAGLEEPLLVPATAAWEGVAAWVPGQAPAAAPQPAAPQSAAVPPALAVSPAPGAGPQLPQPVWVRTPHGWQPVFLAPDQMPSPLLATAPSKAPARHQTPASPEAPASQGPERDS